MRRLLPVLLAALVACQVDVEGAPCRTGHGDCPSGQGCGLDQRCSAAGCKCEGGLVCGTKSGAPTCECPENPGPEFAADPAGSRTLDAAPYPTGVTSPVACRFGRLGDALAAAAAHAAAHPETGAVARAHGNAPVTFGLVETGETFPLEIEPGVLLSTNGAAADPASWIIRADTSSSVDVVTLHDAANVEGFTIASVSASGDVVRLSCASRTTATLRNVVVDGGGVASRGVKVNGPCDVEATELVITRAKGTGLHADVDLASATEPVTGVTISGGAISDNGGNGAEVRAGRLVLLGTATRPLVMARNGGFGVVAKAREEAAVAIALDLEFADVSLNGEAGLVVRNLLQQGSSATIRSTDVHENKASSQSSETVTNRRGGGAIIYGSPAVPLTLVGNRFFSNRYDQLAVVSSELWNLSGADCSGGANVFACPDPNLGGKLIYAVGSQQTVNFAQWSPFPPDTWLVGVNTVTPCPEQSRVPVVCPALP